ncbi:SSI family serine proteinase inhibitor [Nocardia sp. NPDC049707]|uniref:SSI family serine proteinase inhibitor n=1 Tax=Nocardia sp. NPDC049707 TaxID=3154735 RepID=UPI0034198CBF
MISYSLRTIATICLAVAVAGLSATPAGADPGLSELSLSVSKGEAQSPGAEQVTLTCDPPAGSHPAASEACAALATADGAFDKLVGDPGGLCMEIYNPVTATVAGTWHGRNIQWQKTFGNSCQLRAATTPVFDFVTG